MKPGGFAKDVAAEKPKIMEKLKQRTKKWMQIEEWVRNNKAKSQAAKQERDKKEKGKTTYSWKSRDSEKTYNRSGRPPRGAYSNMPPLRCPPRGYTRKLCTQNSRTDLPHCAHNRRTKINFAYAIRTMGTISINVST
jgi:hypothetical protein